MEDRQQLQIEAEAARALLEWKTIFADQVVQEAKKRASGNVLTLADFRKAGMVALQSLSKIMNVEPNDDQRDAA